MTSSLLKIFWGSTPRPVLYCPMHFFYASDAHALQILCNFHHSFANHAVIFQTSGCFLLTILESRFVLLLHNVKSVSRHIKLAWFVYQLQWTSSLCGIFSHFYSCLLLLQTLDWPKHRTKSCWEVWKVVVGGGGEGVAVAGEMRREMAQWGTWRQAELSKQDGGEGLVWAGWRVLKQMRWEVNNGPWAQESELGNSNKKQQLKH